MKNELHRHKRSDAVKWVLILLAVLILATAVTAAITKGFKDFNPYGWLDKFENKVENLYAVSGVSHELTDKSAELDEASDVDREYAASNVNLKATDTVLFIIDDLPVKVTIDELSVGVDKSDANTAHDEITVTDEGTYDITLKHYKDSDAWQACFVQAAASEEPEVKSLSLSVKPRAAANTTDDGVSASSDDNEYLISATVLPENASCKRLVWSAAFETGSTKDVSQYVTVTQSNNLSTAIVRCIQPFDELIKITVCSEICPDVTASIDCRYKQKLTGIDSSGTTSKIVLNGTHVMTGKPVISSLYTDADPVLAGTPTYTIRFTVNPEFKDYLFRNAGYPDFTPRAVTVNLSDAVTGSSYRKETVFNENAFKAWFGDQLFTKTYIQGFGSCLIRDTVKPLFCTVTISYNGNVMYSSTGAVDIDPDPFMSYVFPSSVSSASETITF